MQELLVPGYRVLIRPRPEPHRKTGFDLALVDLGFSLVSADARLPNALVAEAWAQGRLPQFQGYPKIRREVTFGESRLDLLLERPGGLCYVETKSVTLVVDGVGLFPDAPTGRGAKHVRSLVRAVQAGHRAAVVFVIQRDDSEAFSPHDTADPEFGIALRRGLEAGVEAFAYDCRVTKKEVTLRRGLPIHL
jgi:sugar fermentation stimulation protein A